MAFNTSAAASCGLLPDDGGASTLNFLLPTAADIPTLLILCFSPQLLCSCKHVQRQGGAGAAAACDCGITCANCSYTNMCVFPQKGSIAHSFLFQQLLPRLGTLFFFEEGGLNKRGSINSSTSDATKWTTASSPPVKTECDTCAPTSLPETACESGLPACMSYGAPSVISQPQKETLHYRFPDGCLLQTKYYEAPVKLVFACLTACACTNTAGFVAPAASGDDPSPDKVSAEQNCWWHPQLQLRAPPEAILLISRGLNDLYSDVDAVSAASSPSVASRHCSTSCSEKATTTADAAIAAAAGGTELPIPRILQRPPYGLLQQPQTLPQIRQFSAKAADNELPADVVVGAAKQILAAKAAEAAPIQAGISEMAVAASEAAAVGIKSTVAQSAAPAVQHDARGQEPAKTENCGNWLSSVPVKLLVCFEGDEGKGSPAAVSGGEHLDWQRENVKRGSSYIANQMDVDDDPSEVLFFGDSLFIEKISLSFSQPGAGGPPSAASASAVSSLLLSRAAVSAEEQIALEPVSRCLLSQANEGSISSDSRGLLRVVEALHCHLWSSMRLIQKKNSLSTKRYEFLPGSSSCQHHNNINTKDSSFCNTSSGISIRAENVSGAQQVNALEDAKAMVQTAEKDIAVECSNTTVATTFRGGTPKKSSRTTSVGDNDAAKRDHSTMQTIGNLIQKVRDARSEMQSLSREERATKAERLALQLTQAFNIFEDEI